MDDAPTEAATALAQPRTCRGFSTSTSHAAAALPARHGRCCSHYTSTTPALGSRLASDRHFTSRPRSAHDSLETSSREALRWGLLQTHSPRRYSRPPLPSSTLHRSGCQAHPRTHHVPPCSDHLGLICSYMGSCHRGGTTTTQRRPPPCRLSEDVEAGLSARAPLAPPAASGRARVASR